MNSKLHNFTEAKKSFEAAYRVADRCGDREGAGRAMLVMVEEIGGRLNQEEKEQVSIHLNRLVTATQQTSLRIRIEKSLVVLNG